MKVVYRVISALLALAILPVMFFQPLVRIVFSPTDVLVEETVSIKKAIDLFTGDGLFSGLAGDGGFVMTDALRGRMPALITTAVFLAVSVLLAVLIFFFSALSIKKKLITIFAGSGLLTTIAAFIAFSNAVSPIVSGEIRIADLFDVGIIASIITSFVNIEIIQLSSAAILMAVLFTAIGIWGLCFIMPDLGEEKKLTKKQKKVTVHK
jgi:hypothetical protein